MMGRPVVSKKQFVLPSFDFIIEDVRFVLTFLNSLSKDGARMPTPLNIVMKIRQELLEQTDQLKEVEQEMSKLEPAYVRFRQLVEKAEGLKQEIREAAAVIGPEEFALEVADDYTRKDTSLSLPVEKLREKLPVWRAMVRIVKHVPWIQIVDLQETLYEMGFAVSRAAIESALTVHRKVFRVKHIERAKFVALMD